MLLGVDVGTTNLKAVAYDHDKGTIVAVARRPTRTHRPRPGWAEFAPDELWEDTAATIREVVHSVAPAHIEAIAIGSMGESGLLLDADLQPLGPMIAWFDNRTEEQVTWWRSVLDPWEIYRITGVILDAKFSVNHVLWWRAHHPARFAAARHWLSVPDFLIWKLSGQFVTDVTIASRTMLLDQRALDWSPELLDYAGLRRELFCPVVPGGTRIGGITTAASAQTGLPPATAVVTGGHDHLVGAFAAGVAQPGGVLDSTGTAAVLLQVRDRFAPRRVLYDAGLATYAFVSPGTYAVLGSIDLAGGAVEWLIHLLWGEGPDASSRAFEAAAAAPRGSAGSIWLPHFLGSGTPHRDAVARAGLFGLRPQHDRGDLLRSLLEGLAYWLRDNLEIAVEHAGLPIESQVIAIGGATRSGFWNQLKADVCGRVFRVPQVAESVALGAALLAGIGAGVLEDSEQAIGSVQRREETFVPDREATREYDRWFNEVYRKLYPAIREINTSIEALRAHE